MKDSADQITRGAQNPHDVHFTSEFFVLDMLINRGEAKPVWQKFADVIEAATGQDMFLIMCLPGA